MTKEECSICFDEFDSDEMCEPWEGFVVCEPCLIDLEDTIGKKGLALAHHLDISPSNIQMSSWDDSSFEISPRMKKQGIAPSKAVRRVDALKEALDAVNSAVTGLTIDQAIEWAKDLPGFWKAIQDKENELEGIYRFPPRVARTEREAEMIRNLALEAFPPQRYLYNWFAPHLEFDEKNAMYFVFLDDESDKWHVRAYRAAWDNLPIADERKSYQTNSGEYLVLEDDEADDRWDEYLENYIDEIILPEVPELARHYFDREAWKRDARMDGRGHCLNNCDGTEDEIWYEAERYFVYRTN